MKHTYKYPRPALTADCVVFGIKGKLLHVLLVERGGEPYKGKFALPGGFLKADETAEAAAVRELAEETGLSVNKAMRCVGVWSAPGRDPRGWVVSVAYMALVRPEAVKGGSDAARALWVPAVNALGLAFDHDDILWNAMEALRDDTRRRPVGIDLLPERFTLSRLQVVYEAVLGTTLDKRNFRRKALAFGVLRRVKGTERGSQRPAAMYAFNYSKYRELERRGIGVTF